MSINQLVSRAHGQEIINLFCESTLNLSSNQILQVIQIFQPYYLLLQIGALQAFLDESVNIPIDGTLITSALVSSLQSMAQNYINVDSSL